jgi:hypothetical protein
METCTEDTEKVRRRELIYTTRCFERMDLFYDLDLLHDLYYTQVGGRTPFPASTLVHAQTTSYQNFWQEMGNVQTLTEAELGFIFRHSSFPAPSGGADQTFTL